MKLGYSILWFDDNEAFIDSLDTDSLKETINSWGFTSRIDPVHNADEFYKHKPFEKYDLIVVDFDLGGTEEGHKFIKDIRDNQVYTEIIFYSTKASSDLWESIKEHQLEGIFVANRSVIIEKIRRVAHQSVRKVLDVENMRGIVMAEVGDLDALLEDIFIHAMEDITPQQQQDVFSRFHKKTDKQIQGQSEALNSFKESPSIDGLLKLCDSNKRWENYNRVKNHHDLLKKGTISSSYATEILQPRNFLAHGVSRQQDDGTFVFQYQGKEYQFNNDVGKALRLKILAYKTAFAAVIKTLKG